MKEREVCILSGACDLTWVVQHDIKVTTHHSPFISEPREEAADSCAMEHGMRELAGM